jgi:hypothetical protein
VEGTLRLSIHRFVRASTYPENKDNPTKISNFQYLISLINYTFCTGRTVQCKLLIRLMIIFRGSMYCAVYAAAVLHMQHAYYYTVLRGLNFNNAVGRAFPWNPSLARGHWLHWTIATVIFSFFGSKKTGRILFAVRLGAQKYYFLNSKSRIHSLRQLFSGSVRLGLP